MERKREGGKWGRAGEKARRREGSWCERERKAERFLTTGDVDVITGTKANRIVSRGKCFESFCVRYKLD